MGIEIKWNNEWEKKLQQEAMKSLLPETQKFFDSFARRYAGKSVATIKQALRSEWRQKMNGTMSDRELTDYAEAVARGDEIKIRR